MMPGQSGAALVLTALALFVFRAGGLVLAERLGPRSQVLAWASAVSYSLLAVYVVQTLIAPASSLQATPTATRVAAAGLAVAGFTLVGRGLFQWLVIGAAAFSLGIGADRESRSAVAAKGAAPAVKAVQSPLDLPPIRPAFLMLHANERGSSTGPAIAAPPSPWCVLPAPKFSAPPCVDAWAQDVWPRAADICWPRVCHHRSWTPQPVGAALIEQPARSRDRERASSPERDKGNGGLARQVN